MPKSLKVFLFLFLSSLIVWVLWSQLMVKPLSKDLSVIGQGKPTLVLIYESYSPVGMDAMGVINQVRNDFNKDMYFRVAHLGTPEGDTFAERFEAFDGVMVILDENGEPLTAAMLPATARLLSQELKGVLR